MAEAVDSELPFYLRGLHAPIPDEVEAFDLPIEGAIPPELDGLFLRNGPNPLRGDPGHWFLGDGMLHGVSLSGGKALSYRNRFVKTRALAGEARYVDAEGRVDFTAGVANTHVIEHAGRILALVENGLPWEVDASLDTIGYHDFDGRLNGPMTAHPKICPLTGELHFFGYHFADPFLMYHRADAEGRLVESRPIDIPRPVMMHDFAITRDFVIFMDLPIVFSPESIAAGGVPFVWKADAGARLGVMPRSEVGAPIRWLDIDPCYVFHPANAYAEGDRIVLDVAHYDSLWDGRTDTFEVARLHRFELDLGSGTVRETPLDSLAIEFPRIRENLCGLPHRYAYAVWNRNDDSEPGQGLVRYDLESGKREIYDGGEGYTPSEAVFVPADTAGPEAEGWLLSYCYDHAKAASELAIFDAMQLAGGPIARVELPQRVPMGFHGSWVPRREALNLP